MYCILYSELHYITITVFSARLSNSQVATVKLKNWQQIVNCVHLQVTAELIIFTVDNSFFSDSGCMR